MEGRMVGCLQRYRGIKARRYSDCRPRAKLGDPAYLSLKAGDPV